MKKLFTVLCAATLPAILLAGCGNNSTPPVSTLEASQSCIGCHASVVSAVTGMPIVAEWKRSTHNTKNGAGCADCHEPASGHPNNCGTCHNGATPSGTGHDVVVNADQALKCNKCHGPQHPTDIMMQQSPQHFGNMTASIKNTTFRASYVSSLYVGNCRKCHNPHDPTTARTVAAQWGNSGHGDVNAACRTAYDFKTRGTYLPADTTFENYCVRCHTTSGFIHFVGSGFTDLRPFAGYTSTVVQYPAKSSDKTKEVTGCDACHDDGRGNAYGYKLRTVSPFTAYFNISTSKAPKNVKINGDDSKVAFPDAGASNMCVPCHAGRGAGRLIYTAANAPYFLNFSSTSNATSAHDFAGATVLFRTGGYEYAGRDYTNPPAFNHDSIGRNNFMNTGGNGPCIACHMNSGESHSLLPVEFTPALTGIDPTTSLVSAVVSNSCAACHTGTATPVVTAQYLQAKRAGFQAAVACLNGLLTKKKVTGTSNWQRLYGKGTGPNTMGASFNYGLLKWEWGAYAHNDIYAKRLIYDSIDWLYDGNLDTTTNAGGYATDVEAAINSLTTATSPWQSPTYTYTGAELAQLKANAIQYLLGGPGGSRP
ncbi:MAG TPA: cytochrome C [Geobacteraceae bacterium]